MKEAYESGVKAPKPYGYLEDFAVREAFVMERLEGESIGRRVVRKQEFAATREALPRQLAEELTKIHAIPIERLPSLPGAQTEPAAPHVLETLERELDLLEEPHPAIELGLSWLREHLPQSHGIVLNHGDFRVGNFVVDEEGLVGVLDWEFAHLGDPADDLGWLLVRAWRFGEDHLRLGGIGEAEPYLEQYNALTERESSTEDLFYWEVLGNVRWAIGSLNQAKRHLSGQERSVELAILGRLAAEVEYEILFLLERGD
ncbi:MAG TPA: phosphotransferase family protein [Rubrobacteraceae bacterium]|nr:phosphotransferase family protein [Rubrobacteraceae bacterium]